MNIKEAKAAIAKHGSIRGAARVLGVDNSSLRNFIAGKQKTLAIPATPNPATLSAPAPRADAKFPGISLRDMRVSDSKPTDTIKRRLYALKRGIGYPIDHLSEAWGISIDTIRSYAKRNDALKYVETAPGEWVQVTMHPDTAAEITKDREI